MPLVLPDHQLSLVGGATRKMWRTTIAVFLSVFVLLLFLEAPLFAQGVSPSVKREICVAPTCLNLVSRKGPLPSHTLRVRGDRDFKRRLVDALLIICPCYNPTVNDDNTIGFTPLTGSDNQGNDLFCPCYCDHRAGCNLLLDLVTENQETTIKSGHANEYDPDDHEVTWNRRATPEVPIEDGAGDEQDAETPTAITLGHELIHAVHDAKGTRSDNEFEEESNTVRGENELRDETGGPRWRTRHRGRRVPNHRGGDLDKSIRANCECIQ
jgi:hypothetical protein